MEKTKLLKGKAACTGISLPAPLMEATRAQAEAERRPVSWVIRHALLQYLDAIEKATEEKEDHHERE
jgi:hypothetical protein